MSCTILPQLGLYLLKCDLCHSTTLSLAIFCCIDVFYCNCDFISHIVALYLSIVTIFAKNLTLDPRNVFISHSATLNLAGGTFFS